MAPQDVGERLASIETKLDIYAQLTAKVDKLERFMWLTLGIAVASGAPDLASLLK